MKDSNNKDTNNSFGMQNAANFSLGKNTSHDKKDIDAIKNRQTNTTEFGNRLGSLRNRGIDDEEKRTSRSDLPKDKLSDEKDELSENKDEKKGGLLNKNKKKGLKGQAENAFDGLEKVKNIKSTLLKIKVGAIILGIVVAIFAILFVILFFRIMIDNTFGAISSFFGISQPDTEETTNVSEADGLLTAPEYIYKDDNLEEMYTTDELVAHLKKVNKCTNDTAWTKIKDWIDKIDGKSKDPCFYLRYTENYISDLEEEGDFQLDRGLILSSIFYGFGEQPEYFDYKDLDDVDDIIPATETYQTIVDTALDGDVLTIDNIKSLVNSSYLKEEYTYYTWEIQDDMDTDDNVSEDELEEEKEKVKKSVGKCISHDGKLNQYSLQKWEILMRFGEIASEKYQSELEYTDKYNSTDPECRGEYTEDELLERIKEKVEPGTKVRVDKSVGKAIKEFERKPIDTSPFLQKAVSKGTKPDNFNSFGNMKLTYLYGFIYQKFPIFKEAIEDDNLEIYYDSIVTNKEIESIIEYIEERKVYINQTLGFVDQDSKWDFTALGAYVSGAFCGNYLSASLDSINVRITDCDGKYLVTTDFKDYIMGVAYNEVSDSGDNYVLSQMVASITFALHSSNNAHKGTTITMRSGNCAQAWCSMKQGCHAEKSNVSCGSVGNCTSYVPGGGSYHSAASASLQSKYAGYYDTAKNYLIVSGNSVANIHYYSTTQRGWKSKSDAGMSFTQIIQEEYGNDERKLIKCTDYDSTPEENVEKEKDTSENVIADQKGNKKTSEYPEVATDKGKFYGFSYNIGSDNKTININPEWKSANITTINSNCSSGGWNKSYEINKNAVSNYNKAFKNICNILTNGVKLSNGTTCKYSNSNLLDGETFIAKKTSSGSVSIHAYGIAQDWNHSAKIIVNSKDYTPYSNQGIDGKNEYNKFVNALGKEEDCRNINYILWKYAYEPAGFKWGGNFSSDSWDGMHFEVKY